jgi:hypothetical protein
VIDLPKSLTEARAVGAKLYMTDKPCRFGNIAPRLASAGICRCEDCKKLYSNRANDEQKKNPERVKACKSEYRKKKQDWLLAYRRDYKDRCRAQDRSRHLMTSYGITIEQYDDAYAKQEGRCGMCKKHSAESSRKRLEVDHCHQTGRVRGLLCDTCNKALGVIEKYRNKLDEMLAYADQATLQSISDADSLAVRLQSELIATRTLCQVSP